MFLLDELGRRSVTCPTAQFAPPATNPSKMQNHAQIEQREMGKKERQHHKQNSSSSGKQEELLKTLEDFTSKENWDQFFRIRGKDDSFEWYAEWPQVQNLLTTHLSFHSTKPELAVGVTARLGKTEDVAILVPGCGNSKLSEHLYDTGFTNITNVDFSKVVISDMLRRNVRERPRMKWRVMDMTDMQFENETFDAVVDKGGLDALMEPKLGPRLGNQYLSEVKRLLKFGGKYICLTLGESHVLDLLFPKFRLGWKMSLHAIVMEPSCGSLNLQTFMVVAEKGSDSISSISSFMDQCSVETRGNQANEVLKALEGENRVRTEYSNGSDILYSLEDLKLGATGNIRKLEPGRRVKLTLGELGVSRFFYNSVLLDAQQELGPFSYNFGAFLVPKTRAHEWIFSSAEGQWVIVESSKTARLLMVLLDSSNGNASMEDIQKDLSPLIKQLAPEDCDDGVQIPFMAASDGIKQRTTVYQITSELTGSMVVDDVIYEKIDGDLDHLFPYKELTFRRLTFQRTENLVQSEALLLADNDQDIVSSEVDAKKYRASSKSRKKGKQRNTLPSSGSHTEASRTEMKVNHSFLASSYHNGIISGLMLFSFHLEGAVLSGSMVKVVVIGLGAGLLPMFLSKCLPSVQLEVVELDPVVFDVARDYFGFREDEHLKVHIADGIKFVGEMADTKAVGATTINKEDDLLNGNLLSGGESDQTSSSKIDVLIVDVDSSDSSSGLACPAADFVEESFLINAKSSLSEQGLFVINLVSRSKIVKDAVLSKLGSVFSNLFSLQLEEDVNEVIFALKTNSLIKDDQFSEALNRLARSLELENKSWSQRVIDSSKFIKRLR